jgi:UDP-GlcNAc:undecaprenyl-phosphate/decaprenyl-phosphate GlcNAc-1-phosphate transferase
MHVLILGFITAFIITFLAIPAIITVAKARKLFDLPNNRSSHDTPTPSLGGIGIFGGVICGIILWTPSEYFDQLQYIIAAIILLFLVGTRDDLVPIPPFKKLIVQILAALILVYKAKVVIHDWWGLLGVNALPDLAAFIFSLVAIVGIINAFNLTDGIDGLAGSIGLFCTLFFGGWFYVSGHIEWSVVAFSLAGALTAFLKFNFTPAKIFMGDTGSLLIGLICGVMAIEFINLNQSLPNGHPYFCAGAPVVALSTLFIPIYDTLRVFVRRMSKGHSPFHADKTHLHHMLLDGGFSHVQSTAILLVVNALLVVSSLLLQPLGVNKMLAVLAVLAVLLNLLLSQWILVRKKAMAVSDNY